MAALKYRRFVLVVDDGSIHKSLFAAKLVEQFRKKDIALTLVAANDGAQASVKAVNQSFHGVILDTNVPRLEECNFATRTDALKASKLYVVSSTTPDKLAAPLRAGRHFSKPCDTEELIECLLQDLSAGTVEEEVASEGAKFSVDVRVINAIITSTLKVLTQFGIQEIIMEKPQIKNYQDPLGGCISSVLDIVSKTFQGQLAISFDQKSFLELVSGMLGEEQTEINAENQDAVGEINNIIYGNARSDLAQFGVANTIPKILQGEGKSLTCPNGSAAMRVPFKTNKGLFYIEVMAHPLD